MQNYKKILFSFFLAAFVFTVNFFPLPAKAFAPDVVAINSAKWVWEKVEKLYDVVQGVVGAQLANRTLEMYVNTVAYDIATELASGGPGGKPLFRVKNMTRTLQDASEAAAGEFLGLLTEKGFDDLGINLCNPSASLKLTFTLSLVDSQAPPKPKCEWRSVVRNWSNFEKNVQNDLIKVQLRTSSGATSTRAFFEDLSENSELGDYLKLSAAFNRKKIEAEKALELTIEQCRTFLSKEEPVSGDVLTSCQVHEELQGLIFDKAKADEERILASKEAASNKKLSDILIGAADKFASTFTSKLLRYYVRQGTWSVLGMLGKDNSATSGSDYRNRLLSLLRGGSDLLQPRNADLFARFKKIDIGQLESYDYLTNFTLCPDQFSNPDNCTISPSFLQAITAKLTVREAINQGIINGKLPLIGPDDPINGNKDRCYNDALCYSNLIKMRKVNLVPVGWEMASMRGPVTLAEAIDCFEDGGNCKYGKSADYAIDGVDHNPFYHLIDGDWVLKAPKAACDALVYSAVLESPNTSNRQQYCADPKVCLQEDANGNCLDGQYGYCTRSENVWLFDGQACEDGDIYSGCLTFSHSEFRDASYIESTLDYCTADEAGCRRHSQEINNSGDWIFEDINSDDNDLFLNRQASSCSADQAGCSQFIVMAADTNANFLPNGNFEINNDADPRPDGYSYAGNPQVVAGQGVNGSNALLSIINTNYVYLSDFRVMPNTTYTLSVDVKINSANPGSGDARIMVSGCQDENGYYGGIDSFDGSMIVENENNPDRYVADPNPFNEANLLVPVGRLSDDYYTRITGNFYSGNSVTCNFGIGANYGSAPHYFDNFKVEAVSYPKVNASYSDYGQGATVYMDGNRFMCLEEEVGCQGYLPVNGDPMIPAVISPDNLCPNECVGYATFSEQTDIFDIIENPAADVTYYNFIPTTAQSCPAQDVGCEEFTNLEEVAAGGEGREYYTYLRQCVPENYANVYYTWEGSDVAGYQLKTWALLRSYNDAPCTNVTPGSNNCADNAGNRALCGPETPGNPNDDPEVDPNCREFFDVDGNSHFRMQDRVIFASNDCHEYRRTLTGQIYKAIPSLSIACAQSSNNCRSYYGNAANNIRMLFSDNFENGTYSPWRLLSGSVIDLSSESLNNNGHSLKFRANSRLARDIKQAQIRDKHEYELTWWMKSNVFLSSMQVRIVGADGDGRNIDVSMIDASDSNFSNIAAGNWRRYKTSLYLDNFNLNTGNLTSLDIVFLGASANNEDIFIDNVIFKEVTNSFSFIRNSWQTPVSCDSPYQGYHLGCQAYVDTNNNAFNIRTFDRLCRENAIGCLPAIDTHNSSNPFAETFNQGDLSQITVLADSLVYLVPSVENYCSPSLKGCSALGLQSRDDPSQTDTVYKINDPDRYASIMCNSDSLGCEEYNSSKGSYYFKDPGADTCTYQENLVIAGSKYSGWFRTESLAGNDPIGCTDDGDATIEPEDLGFTWDYCHNPADINERWNYFNSYNCETNGGTWFDYSTAATCPASKNLCTSFKDPSDPLNCDPTIINPDIAGYCSNAAHDNERDCTNGLCSDPLYRTQTACVAAGETWTPPGLWTSRCQDYYYYDGQLDEASCNSQVDKNNGCMLFYEANNWNAEHSRTVGLYDADQTYNRSILNNSPTSPVNCDPGFDPNCDLNANRLIKVSRDRQCAEWLACKSSTAVWDQDAGEYKVICDNLSSCIEYNNSGDSTGGKCKTWGTYDEELSPLTFDLYQTRTSGPRDYLAWGDKEYTGYSMPDYLPIQNLFVYNFGDSDSPNPRLVHDVYDTSDVFSGRRYFEACVDTANPGLPNLDGAACSTVLNGQNFYGECQAGFCMVNPKSGVTATSTFAVETRGYALAEAPFPASINLSDGQRISRYNSANVCENGSAYPNGCEQSFIKATYGYDNTVRYYPENMVRPYGICTSGNTATLGNECQENKECDSLDNKGEPRHDGVCSIIKEVVNFTNWPGICLEYDRSTQLITDNKNSFYCNQWYPAAKISGTASLYDNYREAGYYDVTGSNALFCSAAEPYELPEDRYYCAKSVYIGESQYYCTVLVKVPAGSLVHADAMSLYSEAILYGYLNPDKMRAYDSDDVVWNGQSGEYRFEGSLGVDWLHRAGATALFQGNWASNTHKNPLPLSAGARGDQGSNLFFVTDFDPTGKLGLDDLSVLPALNMSLLQSGDFFYTPPGEEVEFYYYSSVVDRNGNNHWKAGTVWPFTVASRLPLGMRVYYWHLDDGNCDSGECRQCPPGYHNIWDNAHLDGIPQPGNNKRGWDGHGNLEKDRYCAPMEHAIYILASNDNLAQEVTYCSENYCGSFDGISRGLDCLRQSGSFYDGVVVPATGCAGDPNCEYKECMENTVFPADDGNHPWCSDFGDIATTEITIRYRCRPSGGGFNFPFNHYESYQNVTGISPCLDKIYNAVPTAIPSEITVNGVSCEIVLPAVASEYNRLIVRPSVNQSLLDQISNSNGNGCFDPNPDDDTILRDCRVETVGGAFYDLSNGREVRLRLGILVGGRYSTFEAGNECQELDCYQQCSIITQLDPQGDLSWVRTDIWWRNKTTGDRVIVPRWTSWYYSNDYIRGDDVTYDDIISQAYNLPSHFGAARRDLDDGVVVTRVPLSSILGQSAAATFFGYYNAASTTRESVWNYAARALANLFARPYSLGWNSGTQEYEFYEAEAIGGDNRNTYAGRDYRPRALAVCGNGLCELSPGVYAEGISVNETRTGPLFGSGGSYFVSVKFFYHAHPDHMPIYSIDVDWGDGLTGAYTLNPGRYKNSLPDCDSNQTMPGLPDSLQGFGGLSGSCHEGFKVLYHDYQYDLESAGIGHPCDGLSGRPSIANASCYRPIVRIVDRWGWTNEFPFGGSTPSVADDWIVVYGD